MPDYTKALSVAPVVSPRNTRGVNSDTLAVYDMMDEMMQRDGRIPDPSPYSVEDYRQDLLNLVIDETRPRVQSPQTTHTWSRQAPGAMEQALSRAPAQAPMRAPSQLREVQEGRLSIAPQRRQLRREPSRIQHREGRLRAALDREKEARLQEAIRRTRGIPLSEFQSGPRTPEADLDIELLRNTLSEYDIARAAEEMLSRPMPSREQLLMRAHGLVPADAR